MTTYVAVKWLHVLCVVISGSGFIVRGVLRAIDSRWLHSRAAKVLPHAVDTILLASALTLAVLSGQYPFVSTWLTAKVFGLIAYIVLGTVALRQARTKPARLMATAAAALCFCYIVSVAVTRHPAGFLAGLGG